MYWDSITQVAGSNFTTTSTTAVDVTGLTFAATAGHLYEIEVFLKVASSTSVGNNYRMNVTGASNGGQWILFASGGASGVVSGGAGFGTGEVTATTISTQDGVVTMKAFCGLSNSGTISVQIDKSTSGTATVYVGSVMKIKQLA